MERKTIKFDGWPLELDPHLIGVESWKIQAFIRSYYSYFVFSLQDLEDYKGKPIHIQLEGDHPIFWKPYRLTVFEQIGIWAHCRELLAPRLIKFSNKKHADTMVMPSKKISLATGWRSGCAGMTF